MEYFYEFAKTVHIISVIAWFAGLFYLPRLFIYHIEQLERKGMDEATMKITFQTMERKLYRIIMNPGLCFTVLWGLALTYYFWPLSEQPWLMIKLIHVLFVIAFHIALGFIGRDLIANRCNWTSKEMRFFNEVPTLLLINIVYLVIYKDVFSYYVILFFDLILAFILYKALIHRKRVSI